MALLDLSAVTRTLMNVIDKSVNASPGWPGLPAPRLMVSPQPPDRLAGDAVAGLYLYHLSEDPAFKNQPPPAGETELRFTPMALNLYYVLGARSIEGDAGVLTEQLIMGLAVKALRDLPVIDDKTTIGGVKVLDPHMSDLHNRVRITLQPVPAAEAVSYWTAGSSPLRLSAYYQVGVVLLEPDPPQHGGGRVTSFGVQVFTAGGPQLTGSESVSVFQVPGEPAPRRVTARPAQVSQLGGGDSFTLLGSGLAGGNLTLLLRSVTAAAPLKADAAWKVQRTAAGLTAQAQTQASGVATPPGVYAASVQLDRLLQPPGGPRLLSQVSNETPIVITPGVQAISAPDAAGRFQIDGEGFTPAAAVTLYLGAERAAPGNAAALAAGEFAAPTAQTLVARLPVGLAPGAVVPLRLIVNGAEAAPQWVTAP